MNTREQRYARTVYTQVAEVKQQYPDKNHVYRRKYGAMAHKLPVLIRTAGLAQALAFVESREEAAKDAVKSGPLHRLLDHLAAVTDRGGRAALLTASRELELGGYMRLTQQVLAALVWYKRFAESVLEVTVGTDPEPGPVAPAPSIAEGGS